MGYGCSDSRNRVYAKYPIMLNEEAKCIGLLYIYIYIYIYIYT